AVMAQKAAGTGKNGVVLTASYIFGNGSNVRVKASYNLWNIYKRIESAGSRSHGFLGLSKVAFHNLSETIRGGDDFHFDFYAEDPVDAAEEPKIRDQLKAELMTRVANAFAQFSPAPALPGQPARADYPGNVRLTWITPTWNFFGTVSFKTLEN